MACVFGKALRTFTSEDGKSYLDILAREDGLFQFLAYAFTEDGGYEYWIPVQISGYYDSADAAETDARRTVPWFRESN